MGSRTAGAAGQLAEHDGPAAVARDMTALMPPMVAVEVTPTPVSTKDSSTISA